MKFIKVTNRTGFNHDHGTRFVVIDLQRSTNEINIEAGINRLPRRNSRFWDDSRYMVWDVEAKTYARQNCAIGGPRMNTQAKQAPGQWYAKTTSAGQGLVIDETTGATIAVTYAPEHAPLVAAAPKLLEAVEMLCPLSHLDTCAGLNFIRGSEERENACTCGATKARAAIAEAKGEA
jgi:hypothetical protein